MNRILEVDVIRPVAILLVVFTHCFAIFNGAWTNPDNNLVPYVLEYDLLTSFLSSFRMPAVILCAGYIHAYFYLQKERKSLKQMIRSKFERLLIPAYVFGVIYFLMFKEFSTYDFFYQVTSGAGHLWFLPMLFWNFVFGFFTVKVSKLKFQIVTFILLIFLSVISTQIPNYFGIAKGIAYLPYFYTGIFLWYNRQFIIYYFTNIKRTIGVFVLYLAFFYAYRFFFRNDLSEDSNLIKVMQYYSEVLLNIIGVFTFYIIVIRVVLKKPLDKVTRVHPLVNYSYGIYVFHQFLLLILIYNLHIYKYISYYFLPYILFVAVTVVSYLLTKLFLKTTIGRYLIG